VHAQNIKNLFINRSKGIEIIGVLRLSNTLILNGPIIVNEQREGLIEFGIDALIQNNLSPYLIQGWVGITEKHEFIFPIGSDKKFMPIGVNSTGSIKKKYNWPKPSNKNNSWASKPKIWEYLQYSKLPF